MLSAPARPERLSFRTTRSRSSADPSERARPVGRPVVDDDELEIAYRLTEDALGAASAIVASASRCGKDDETAGSATAGVRVACGGGGSGSDLRFDLVVATVDRTDDAGGAPRLARGADPPAFRLVVVDQNADDAGPRRVLRAHAAARRPAPPLAARPLARAQRGASRARRADVVAFPDDDCRLPTRSARAASPSGFGATALGRPHGPGRRRRRARPTRGARRASRRADDPRTLEPRDLVRALPPPDVVASVGRLRRAARARGRGRRGRRARRSSTSCAPSGPAPASTTTPT